MGRLDLVADHSLLVHVDSSPESSVIRPNLHVLCPDGGPVRHGSNCGDRGRPAVHPPAGGECLAIPTACGAYGIGACRCWLVYSAANRLAFGSGFDQHRKYLAQSIACAICRTMAIRSS